LIDKINIYNTVILVSNIDEKVILVWSTSSTGIYEKKQQKLLLKAKKCT